MGQMLQETSVDETHQIPCDDLTGAENMCGKRKINHLNFSLRLKEEKLGEFPSNIGMMKIP